MSERISKDDLRKRTGEWIAAGKAVAGPMQVQPGTVLGAVDRTGAAGSGLRPGLPVIAGQVT